MDTKTFLEKILPTQGRYVLAVFRNGNGAPPSHAWLDSIAALAASAQQLDRAGTTVYHACSSFLAKDGGRKGANVAFCRSLWLDLDVGPTKEYPSARDALMALHATCKALQVPGPMIVSSGRGLHCYWTYTRDVPADEARTIGRRALAAFEAVGFEHDTSRTGELASILRPVGTTWRKEEDRPVRLIRDAEPIDPEVLLEAFERVAPRGPSALFEMGDDLSSGPKDYPPSSGLVLIEHCATLRHVAENQDAVEEPLWRAMLGVVKHTIEGEDLAHQWSEGHPEYNQRSTQKKVEGWTTGPTTCEQFRRLSPATCAGCQKAVTSPIQLGYAVEITPVEPPPERMEEITIDTALPAEPLDSFESLACMSPSQFPHWPAGYRLTEAGTLEGSVRDEEGTVAFVPFANKLFYPYAIVTEEDGSQSLQVCAKKKPNGSQWMRFRIPCKLFGNPRGFIENLSNFGVIVLGGVTGKKLVQQFVEDVWKALSNSGIEMTTYKTCGWHDDGFVLGTTKITAKGETDVSPHEEMGDTGTDLGVSGTRDEWIELVNTLYNRPGAEAYQFVFCAAFGSPLIELMGLDEWHGIPVALSGPTALGKTTTCRLATSIFGKGSHFVRTATQQGMTLAAMFRRAATYRNLPWVLDELTDRDSKELQEILFAMSNGKPKDRCKPDGTLVVSKLSWNLTTFITGNVNFTALLGNLDNLKGEASQLRVFEIPLPADYNERVFHDVNPGKLIEQGLSRQYGVVGREYLQYVAKNKEDILSVVKTLREKYYKEEDATRERFYLGAVITAVVGGLVARKMGLIRFDMNALLKWATNHVKSLRTLRANSSFTPSDYLNQFLSDMHGRIVYTQHYSDGRSGRIEEPMDRVVGSPCVRIATADRRVLVSLKAFNEWCGETRVQAGWLKDELLKAGFIVVRLNGGKNERIFKGTTVAGAPCQAIEFDYEQLIANDVHLTVVPSTTTKEATHDQ